MYPACRLCMENCPWDGIDVTVDPPILHQPCTYCGGLCEAICPTGVINWDASREAVRVWEEKNPKARSHVDELVFLH